MENKEVVIVYFDGKDHVYIEVDATPHLLDGGDEESAMDWAHEKFGQGRGEVVWCEFGDASYVQARRAAHYPYASLSI